MKTLLLHVDIDSPAVLARFWGLPDRPDPADFYETAMNRALGFFAECGATATFFCVGAELDRPAAREAVRRAHEAGHEIANHSHSHFYAPGGMPESELRDDVLRCSEAIRRVTGAPPAGFRAPGYAIGGRLMKVLRDCSLRYDSSALWTPATAWMKRLHRSRSKAVFQDSYGETDASVPRTPYFPDPDDWKRPGPRGGLLEIPLPRSPFGLTPFYNNFHLSMPDALRAVDAEAVRAEPLVYLFHLIEFCDLSDGLPAALSVHPNVPVPAALKLARMRDTVRRLLKRYRVRRTDRYAESFGSL